jgi:hypothetical protein
MGTRSHRPSSCRCYPRDSKGFRHSTPVRTTCFVFLVASTRPCTRAVAANNPSMGDRPKAASSRPHSCATDRSTARMRLPCSRSSRAAHRSRARADFPSRRRKVSMPRRISPSTSTLSHSDRPSTLAYHATRFGFARVPFRSSETMFVSRSSPLKRGPFAAWHGASRSPRRCQRSASRPEGLSASPRPVPKALLEGPLDARPQRSGCARQRAA